MNKRPSRNGDKTEKVQNTLLVDGNALFKHGFFGAKNQYNSNGQHIGGVYAFITILRKLLTEDLYHKVYVFWDGNLSGKLRYNFYEPYKSTRGKDFKNGTFPIDENELIERKIVWDYLNEMYIRQLMDDIIESDDFIAYYCLNKNVNEKITICSLDRDFCQLISNDIRIYFLDLKKYVDSINYSLYFPHHQENSLLLKIITGDNSDTIFGVKGVKEKTLLKYFPELSHRKCTIDEIIDSAINQQQQRLFKKQKPLKVFDYLINRVTLGPQGRNLFEINEKLINLKKPLLTENGIKEFENLKNGTLDSSGRELKNIFLMMKRDGLDKEMSSDRFNEYLIPFKKLIERERNNN